MIPSTTNKYLVAENWTKIYQSFKNAEFQSYDFETLRRTMITYLQQNYPEDFNDYIDSSEFIALVDLIAFLGQNLSFRIDLNARENFIETAERRDSILRLAYLINYNPSRNISANGFLKVSSVFTTENIYDSNGINLANNIIGWNDPTNPNWYQQFITVMNAAISSPNAFGNPAASKVINGIQTDQYKINSSGNGLPVFGFNANIAGTSMPFELVSSSFANKNYIYEEPPRPGNQLGIIFQNDNQGSGSANTGFFVQFKQGALASSTFSIDSPVPNELIGVNVSNINNTDVWLWQLSSNGSTPNTLWTQVPAVTGNNVIYNSISLGNRNFYAVISRANDQIDLSFADGSFGNLPNGSFILYYRQSNGQTYSVTPQQMNNISVQIPYTNKSGQSQNLTLVLSLQYTVSNAAASQSNSDIVLKAPQTYYTQNRMITGEDYNIAPLNVDPDIIKVKSINRVSSGISKYYELTDISGAYSSTDIFASDGILYKETNLNNFEFSFTTRNQIFSTISTRLASVIDSPSFYAFYLDSNNYPRINLQSYNLKWTQSTTANNDQSTGYFSALSVSSFTPVSIGSFGSNNLAYLVPGTLIKFIPPTPGQYFLPNGKLTTVADDTTVSYIWIQIANVIGDGSNTGLGTLNNGTGPVILSGVVPTGSIPTEVIPPFQTILPYGLEVEIANLSLAKRNFGLSFSVSSMTWLIIEDTNLNLTSPFSLSNQGNVSNSNLDSSWMVAFQWTGQQYTVMYRVVEYIFESQGQTAFFVDSSTKNYDFTTDTVIKDRVDVLSNNSVPNNSNVSSTTYKDVNVIVSPNGSVTIVSSDTNQPLAILNSAGLGINYSWQINSAVVESDGYVNPQKVLVSFYDSNNNGQIQDPDMFDIIVGTSTINAQTGFNDKFVYFQYSSDGSTYSLYNGTIYAYPSFDYVPSSMRIDGQLYYFYVPNIISSYSVITNSFSIQTFANSNNPLYFAYPGRKGLKFHYVHNSGSQRRLDPSKMNIVDVYLLSSSYDIAYRNWLSSGTGTPPLPPTTQSLENTYSATLEPIKAISDEIIYHPARYKVLFGSQAAPALQATFKAVQSASSTANTTELQTKILNAINQFFSIENWDFGQTFNFGELLTYVMNIMTPDIVNFVIVPNSSDSVFGNLFQITCESNEIFVSGATVNNIQIINNLTASSLNASSLVTSS